MNNKRKILIIKRIKFFLKKNLLKKTFYDTEYLKSYPMLVNQNL
jgi:hypothetical protein